MTPYELEVLKKVVAACKRLGVAGADRFAARVEAENLIEAEERTEETFDKQIVRGMDFYLCVGPNAWGRGFSVEQAIAEAARENPASRKQYIVYHANTKRTPMAYISDMGGLCYRGESPVRVAEHGIPGRKAFSSTKA